MTAGGIERQRGAFDNRMTLTRRQRQRVHTPLVARHGAEQNRLAAWQGRRPDVEHVLSLASELGQWRGGAAGGSPSAPVRTNTNRSSGVHVTPYRKFTSSVTVVLRPSDSEIAFRTPAAVTTAIDRPSGENMHDVAFSLPRTGARRS